jgi:hypothetical protein
MKKRTVVAVLWAIASCVFLWLFSLVQAKELPGSPSPLDLFDSFLLFSFMLLGGGACYHFMTEILEAPYDADTSKLWTSLLKNMLFIMVVIVSVPVVILIMRENLGAGLAKLLSLAFLPISFGLAFWRGYAVERLFREIRANKQL